MTFRAPPCICPQTYGVIRIV